MKVQQKANILIMTTKFLKTYYQLKKIYTDRNQELFRMENLN